MKLKKLKLSEIWELRLFIIGLFMSLPTITGLLLLALETIK
jgi:hypothetical protein